MLRTLPLANKWTKSSNNKYNVEYLLPPLWSRGWLGAAAHCHCPTPRESTIPRLLPWEKVKIQNPKYSFYWLEYRFCTSLKIISRTLVSRGLYNGKRRKHQSGPWIPSSQFHRCPSGPSSHTSSGQCPWALLQQVASGPKFKPPRQWRGQLPRVKWEARDEKHWTEAFFRMWTIKFTQQVLWAAVGTRH